MSISEISCGERLSIDKVEGLYSEMEAAIAKGEDIQLNAAEIAYCDSAGLQLVIALQQTLSTTNHHVHWQDPSEVLITTADYLGLRETLHIPSNQATEDPTQTTQ